MRQLTALAIFAVAIAGSAIELANMLGQGYGLADAIWRLLFYFTILTNLTLAGVFGWLAMRPQASPRVVGGVTLAIVLVGVVYWALLEGKADLDGASPLGNFLLHKATPVMALLYWFVFESKGHLDFRDPGRWSVPLLGYLAYALIRGQAEGRYPYPFIDLGLHGWTGVLTNAAVILAGFLLGGLIMVLLDRVMRRR